MLEPRKKKASDGEFYWYVFDTNEMKQSTNMFFARYKTKHDCLDAIDKWKKFVNQFCALS